MFYLPANAKFQGYTRDGLAVYGTKPVTDTPVKPARQTLDLAKIAKARADRDAVAKLLGEQG